MNVVKSADSCSSVSFSMMTSSVSGKKLCSSRTGFLERFSDPLSTENSISGLAEGTGSVLAGIVGLILKIILIFEHIFI